MDGTLLDLDFDDHFWIQFMPTFLPEQHGYSGDDLNLKFHTPMRTTRGTLDWYCVDYWTEQLNMPVMPSMRRHRHLIRWRPGVTDFLRIARLAGLKLIVATNAHREVWQLKADTLDLVQYVDAVVSSHDYGKPKEAEHFWRSIERQLDLNLERCAFFDDSEAVLASAQTHGVGTVVGIDHPNSNRDPRVLNHHLQIRDFADLLPSLRHYRAQTV